jgi:hypothetical protein
MDKLKLLFDLIFQCEARKKARVERIKAMNRKRHEVRKKIRFDAAEKLTRRQAEIARRKNLIDIDVIGLRSACRKYGQFPFDLPETREYQRGQQKAELQRKQ